MVLGMSIRHLHSLQRLSRTERRYRTGLIGVSRLRFLVNQADESAVLLRALHITGDMTKESDYEACE
jgi:hypothetical protein